MTNKKGQDGGNRLTQKTDSQEFNQKPEIDLQSWASLGGNAKTSRAEPKEKRTWKRRAAR